MPVSGFKVGYRVITPGNHAGTVVRVRNNGGEECLVRYEHDARERWFRTAALRRVEA